MPAIELRDHQKLALSRMHNGCILKGGVGSGKTMTALAYYMQHEKPKDLVIFTTARKRDSLDWEGEAARFGIGRERDATVAGTITVDSWNNIGKYVGKTQGCFLIFDEQRLVGSGSWVKAMLKLVKVNRWVMLSATPGDTWMDYIPIFVANGFYKNRTEFIRQHVVYNNFSKFPKVDHFVGEKKLRYYRSKVLVPMPYERHTTRHEQIVPCKFDKTLMDRAIKDRWHIYEDRPIRDIAELFIVMRKIVNTDPSRLEEVIEKHEKHPRLIIFYSFDYELEILRGLRELLPGTTMAEWNGHKHEPVPETDDWVYLVQYAAGAEAWNCITTDAILFYSLTYSYKLFEQSKGRIDRLNTPYKDLHYYILRCTAGIDLAIWKALRQKESFSEAKSASEF